MWDENQALNFLEINAEREENGNYKIQSSIKMNKGKCSLFAVPEKQACIQRCSPNNSS